MKSTTLYTIIQIIVWPVVICIIASVLWTKFNGKRLIDKFRKFKSEQQTLKQEIQKEQPKWICPKCKEEGNEIKIPYGSVEELNKQIEIHNKQVHKMGEDKKESK